MELKPIKIDITTYPNELHSILSGCNQYDNSCSSEARVIFIDKDNGYFLKSAQKGLLKREATMTQYFHSKGLSANVLAYISDAKDWLLTEKIHGDDSATAIYLECPERLVDLFAERLVFLHSLDYSDCPIQSHTKSYLEEAHQHYENGHFDRTQIAKKGYSTAEEAYHIIKEQGHLLKTETLIHGDYCLPNVIIKNWIFAGFIDLELSGVGDRHRDIFSATVTFRINFKTDKYNQRFIDAYGRDKIDENILRVVAAVEVFG